MRVPTGAIDESMNLIHKLGSVLLVWCGLVFVVIAGWKILREGGAVDVFVATELKADETAGATKRAASAAVTTIEKLGNTADAASDTIRQGNKTIAKLGTAITVTQQNITDTTGAVNGTLGSVQASLTVFRNDLHTSMGKLDASLDELPPLFIQARTNLKSLDGLIGSMQPIAANVTSATKHIDGIAGHVEGMAADSEIALHSAYHPTKWAIVRGLMVKGIFGWLGHF